MKRKKKPNNAKKKGGKKKPNPPLFLVYHIAQVHKHITSKPQMLHHPNAFDPKMRLECWMHLEVEDEGWKKEERKQREK